MRSMADIDVGGKTVLVRVDFNVPLDEQQRITDDNRIRATLPTIEALRDKGAKVVLMSHMGKPKGKRVPELSLAPVAARLGEFLGQEVALAPDCIGEEVAPFVEQLQPGEVLLLENLRFHAGETKNDPEFSRTLARWGEIYVDDAFGVTHRAHASVVGVTDYIETCVAGLLLKKEVEYLSTAMENPKRPFVCIVGGAKVSTKLGVLENLMGRVDRFIVGGAMANTFLKAQGFSVGASLVEDDLLDTARDIMERAKAAGVSFYLPVDGVLGTDPKGNLASGVCPYQDIPEGEMLLDIGPASHTLFAEALKDAKTVVWNGPMGAFENQAFSQGSVGLTQFIAGLEAMTIVGGGDTDALVHLCKMADKFSFISTGGGSFLEFLEGKEFPALQVLQS